MLKHRQVKWQSSYDLFCSVTPTGSRCIAQAWQLGLDAGLPCLHLDVLQWLGSSLYPLFVVYHSITIHRAEYVGRMTKWRRAVFRLPYYTLRPGDRLLPNQPSRTSLTSYACIHTSCRPSAALPALSLARNIPSKLDCTRRQPHMKQSASPPTPNIPSSISEPSQQP